MFLCMLAEFSCFMSCHTETLGSLLAVSWRPPSVPHYMGFSIWHLTSLKSARDSQSIKSTGKMRIIILCNIIIELRSYHLSHILRVKAKSGTLLTFKGQGLHEGVTTGPSQSWSATGILRNLIQDKGRMAKAMISKEAVLTQVSQDRRILVIFLFWIIFAFLSVQTLIWSGLILVCIHHSHICWWHLLYCLILVSYKIIYGQQESAKTPGQELPRPRFN